MRHPTVSDNMLGSHTRSHFISLQHSKAAYYIQLYVQFELGHTQHGVVVLHRDMSDVSVSPFCDLLDVHGFLCFFHHHGLDGEDAWVDGLFEVEGVVSGTDSGDVVEVEHIAHLGVFEPERQNHLVSLGHEIRSVVDSERGTNHQEPFVPVADRQCCFVETLVDHGPLAGDANWIQNKKRVVTEPFQSLWRVSLAQDVGCVVVVADNLTNGPRSDHADVGPMGIGWRVWQHGENANHKQQSRRHLHHGRHERRTHVTHGRVVYFRHGKTLDQGVPRGGQVKDLIAGIENGNKRRVYQHERPKCAGNNVVIDDPRRRRHGGKKISPGPGSRSRSSPPDRRRSPRRTRAGTTTDHGPGPGPAAAGAGFASTPRRPVPRRYPKQHCTCFAFEQEFR
ncbi:hypothetical protein OGAPHI_001083 [Ogataea philodendri]|uniref:Uncharacterized protein n=1 Tax=Ogataea philodendri TaxID=1378263 RepID=A0A9P8PE29_9ASCO|nr:uncharacterized protein OGAPHI_001083 [Ogataea philodendri]KAH3670568.1 hypothetical protein OGAPHI_001083 [Ogataea philodendri]